MIKKLRHRFIIVNMCIFSTVLIGILVIIYLTLRVSEMNQAQDIINNAFEFYTVNTANQQKKPFVENEHKEKPFPKEFEENTRFSNTVYIRADEDNQILDIKYPFSEQSDMLEIDNVNTFINEGQGVYVIDEEKFRFNVFKNPLGEYEIILLNRTDEIKDLNNLLIFFVIILVLGLFVLYAISYLLAIWTVKPISVAWEKQKQFIADASHELKTPLSVISTNADVILSNKNETVESQSKWLNYIKNETLRMSELVNDLLFLAKGDFDKKQVEREELDLSRVIVGVCLVFEPLAYEKQKCLNMDITKDISYFANADEMKNLVTILIDNAVKYSKNESIITVSLYKENKKIKLEVENTLSEIPIEVQKNIFERFYRADKSRNRKSGSFGLGLSIAQSIVNSYNGNITVFSKNNNTKFTVILP